jgi:diguanylate cyclase
LVVAAVEGRRRLAEQAASDPLTGLANRRAFEARLEAEVARAERHDSGLVLVVLDLDHLKEVNDTGGHEAGDAHLCALAGALTGAARAEDLVARVGGDEFAWLLPEATAAQAKEAVQRMRVGLGPSISVGVAQFRSGLDADGLMRNADLALYAAKASGRAATSVFEAAE